MTPWLTAPDRVARRWLAAAAAAALVVVGLTARPAAGADYRMAAGTCAAMTVQLAESGAISTTQNAACIEAGLPTTTGPGFMNGSVVPGSLECVQGQISEFEAFVNLTVDSSFYQNVRLLGWSGPASPVTHFVLTNTGLTFVGYGTFVRTAGSCNSAGTATYTGGLSYLDPTF